MNKLMAAGLRNGFLLKNKTSLELITDRRPYDGRMDMAEISAAAVKALRDKTGLPMMECKKALQASGGDEAAAIENLRKEGKKTMASRSGRETEFGRFGVYADVQKGAGAMV